MNYAVIQTGGKQYKVTSGSEILIDKKSITQGAEIIFPEVLLFRDEDNVLIGNPFVAKIKVIGKVMDHIRGEKIEIMKFKAKVRYRRKIGFRPDFTKVKIEKIVREKSLDTREKKK